jgi:HAE1 family hydrophobic/amphiphilic exporter-1
LTVILVPIHDRQRSAKEVADAVRPLIDPKIPNTRVDIGLQNAFGFGGFGGQPIQIAVAGPDPDRLDRLVAAVTEEVRAAEGAVDVNNQNERARSEFEVVVNRARAADLGVTSQTAASSLRTAVDGSIATQFRQPGQDSVDIRLQTTEAFRSSPDNLASLPILSNTGQLVHLGQIGTIVEGSAPTQINHVDRERSVTISASASGLTVGTVSQNIKDRLSAIELPPGYSISYQGEAEQGAEAFGDIFTALGVSVILMYMLMLMLFRSVTLPLAVLVSLPLALVGALGALALTGAAFTLFSLLGIAVLLGLVGKNAILLVDYTDARRKEGMNRTDALLEAGPARLRAIVMTTASIFFGLAPVALGFEEGSELLRAAALVVMGGLLTSTLLTLLFVPAMYTIFDDIQEGISGIVRRIIKPRRYEPEEEAFLAGKPVEPGRPHASEA